MDSLFQLTMVATIISFPSFTVNHTSVYIVQGLESFSFYHAIQALEKGGGERKFLLFIPKSFLSLSILNYEEWTNCKKATLDERGKTKSMAKPLAFPLM